MIRNRGLLHLIFWGACALTVYAAVSLGQALTEALQPHAAGTHHRQSVVVKDLVLVDSAVQSVRVPPQFSYTGGFSAPFLSQQAREAQDKSRSRRAATPSRPHLTFKGILKKDNPLAIIEDENGKTFICRIGESVSGQKILKIQPGQITLSDGRGSYTLNAPDE